jgi:hypothetical protein
MNDDPIGMAKQMAEIVRAAVARAVAPLEARIKTLEELPPPDVAEIAARAAELVPAPADGVSVSLDEVVTALTPTVELALSAIPTPEDGKSVELADVLAVLQPQISEALATIPAPADGRSVTPDEARELLEGLLVKWSVDMERRAADVFERAIDKIPRPKDGRDALDIEDFQMAIADDGRTLTARLKRGETVVEKSVRLPTVQYQGVHEEMRAYERGDVVAWGGNSWICEKDGISARPSAPDSGWRLMAKKGRDGKDGRNGIDMTKPVKIA